MSDIITATIIEQPKERPDLYVGISGVDEYGESDTTDRTCSNAYIDAADVKIDFDPDEPVILVRIPGTASLRDIERRTRRVWLYESTVTGHTSLHLVEPVASDEGDIVTPGTFTADPEATP